MTASNTTTTNTTDTTNNSTTTDNTNTTDTTETNTNTTTDNNNGERHNHVVGDDYSCAYVWVANFIYKMTLTTEGTVKYEEIWQAKPHLNFSNMDNFDENDYR